MLEGTAILEVLFKQFPNSVIPIESHKQSCFSWFVIGVTPLFATVYAGDPGAPGFEGISGMANGVK